MKRLVAGALLLAAALAVLILGVHAPPARRAMLRYAISQLESRYHLRLQAAGLDYNLARLSVRLTGVRVSASHSPQLPFFEAASVAVDFPRQVLSGVLSFDDIRLDGARVRIVRTATGTNLPEGQAGGGEPPALRIDHIAAADLAVSFEDTAANVTIDVPALAVDLTPSAGRMALSRPATIAFAGRRAVVTELRGDARFDGRSLTVRGMRVATPEVRSVVDGTFTVISAMPFFRVRTEGTADVQRLVEWAAASRAPAGTAAFDATIAGPFDRPVADLDVRLAVGGGEMNGTSHIAFDESAPMTLRATWRRIDLDAALAPFVDAGVLLPAGRSDGTLDARGPLGAWSEWDAMATLTIDEAVNRRRRIAMPGDARIAVRGGRWHVEGRHRLANAAPARIVLDARVGADRLADSRLNGRISVAPHSATDLIRALTTIGLLSQFDPVVDGATLAAETQVTGLLRAPLVQADATLTDIRLYGQQLQPIQADVRYDTRREAYRIDATLSPSTLVATSALPIAGRVQGSFAGEGTLSRPAGTARLLLSDASWQDVQIGEVTIDASLDGTRADVTATAPTFNATGMAQIALTAPFTTVADVSASRVDLMLVTARVPALAPLSGTLDLTAHAEGTLSNWRDLSASIEVSALDAVAGTLPIRLDGPARIRYAAESIAVDRAELVAGGARAVASGTLPIRGNENGEIVVRASGDVGDVAQAAIATGLVDLPIVGGAGPVEMVARIGGSLQTPRIAGDLDLGPAAIALASWPLITGVRVSATLDNDVVEVREAAAAFQGAEASGTGSIPVRWLGGRDPANGRRARVTARLLNIGPAVLEPFVDPVTAAELEGSIDVSVAVESATASIEQLTGTASIDRLDVRIADLPLTQRSPTRIQFGDGFARIDSWDWAGQGASLNVAGQVRLADRQTALLANGELDARMLAPFLRDSGIAAGGTIVPRLSITGPLTAPRIDGDLTMAAGEMRLNDPRIVVSGLEGRAVLSRTTVYIPELNGSINGGSLVVRGEVDVVPRDVVSVRLTTSARAMALEVPDGLRSEIDADLTLDVTRTLGADVPTTGGRVAGTVTVLRGSYREPLAVLGSVMTAMRSGAAADVSRSALLDAIALDVRILSDEDLLVDNNTARLAVGADLRIIGTAAQPALSGRADVREGGRIFLGRNVYEVVSGRIDFIDPQAIRPEAAIELTTRAGGEDIDVLVSGSLDAPSVTLSSSNPDLSQADLTALLVTGRRFDELASADAALIGNTVLGNLSGDVLGFAGRSVGLDTLRLGGVASDTVRRDPAIVATDIDPTSRLTFGKSIGRNVDVTLSQSLRRSDAQTWIIDYLPSRRILLRLVSNDEDLRTYEFRHDIAIGAPPVDRRVAVGRPQARRVAAVELTGTLGFDEARLRGLLRLEQGDRFDFSTWQDDRERLERFYRESNHLAARIAATRAETAETVTLTYTVTAGPETEIVVTGVMLELRAIEQLRDAWSLALVDDLLIDEANVVVRNALAEAGYFAAQVASSLTPPGNVRTLTVRVQPGVRTTSAEVAFTVLGGDLRSELAEWSRGDRALQAARNPAAFETALLADLRRLGYLQSTVTVGAPRFSGTDGQVPVTIVVGALYTVQEVRFEGNTLPAAQLLEVAALPTGSPADPVALDDARGRLVAAYRREGFPAVDITVRPAATAVTFAIDEGARQMIAEVTISGHRGVDADVITRAVRIDAGQPLRADDVVQARRRLFDSGLFRRVDVTAEAVGNGTAAGPTTPMRLRVAVEEWPTLRLRYGIQAAEERPEEDPTGREIVPGLSADVTRRTLFGRPISTGAAASYQRRERVARLFLSSPTLLSLPLESSIAVERSRRDFAAATLVTDVSGISFEQRSRLAGHLQLSYAYRFERNHTYDTKPPAGTVFPFDLTVNVARITGSAVWDSRSQPDDPTRGMLLASTVEWGPQAVGSDFRFIRYLAQAYRFTPWRRLVFASAVRTGVVRGLGGQDVIPSERFYAGGSRSVRGVAEDGLGARDFFGDPAGGEALLLLNQEVRFPLIGWLRGVGFVEAGNVFAQPRDLSLRDLTASAGAGVRLATPFALLRADFGRVFNTGDTRWTIGIGHAF